MSRRIKDDFLLFQNFLQEYNLKSCNYSRQQIDKYKVMHKKLYGLLIFTGEFKSQKVYENSMPFLAEMTSDLLLSFFCTVQGMHKAAKLQLRCSIENFLKALTLIRTPSIIKEKNIHRLFEISKADQHFTSSFGVEKIKLIQNDYSILCRTVHSDPVILNPTGALALLPGYNVDLLQELSTLYIRTIESCLGILYLNYPCVVDKMHPENKQDFLDSMSSGTKKRVVKILFEE